MKFYFGSEQACHDAKAILEGDKDATLVAANLSGKIAHPAILPLTMRDPHGTVVRHTNDTLRKIKISVPFLLMGESPVCLDPRRCKTSSVGRARDCQSRGRRFDSGKTPKTENSNLHGFELHRPSNKGTKLLFQVIKAIINQTYPTIPMPVCMVLRFMRLCIRRLLPPLMCANTNYTRTRMCSCF